jgi:hypothetical protein
MANAMYPKFAQALLDKLHDLNTDDFRFMLIDTADETYNSADEFVSNVTGVGIVARMTATLSSPTITNGTFDAADPTINSVSGDPVEAVILYAYNASDAAARLACWIDSSPAISFTPNGSNVTLTLDGAGIFSLV